MDVKAYENIGTSINPVFNQTAAEEDMLPIIDSLATELEKQTAIFEEYNALSVSLKRLAEMRASQKVSNNAIIKEVIKLKKQMLEGVFKTVRILSSANYTKSSWKNAMADVEKAVKLYKNKNLTHAQINTALRLVRTAMGKLKPARKADERGRISDRRKAFSRIDNEIFTNGPGSSTASANESSSINIVSVPAASDIASAATITESV